MLAIPVLFYLKILTRRNLFIQVYITFPAQWKRNREKGEGRGRGEEENRKERPRDGEVLRTAEVVRTE